MVLTHFSPRYAFDNTVATSVEDMAKAARRHMRSSAVLAAYDFMALSVPRGGYRGAMPRRGRR